MLRAAPKNRFGRCSALESIPPERILPLGGTTALCARARRVIESKQDDYIALCSTRRLGFLDHHVRDLNVSSRRFVQK